MNDIAKALMKLRPNAQWVLEGNQFSGLTWLDESQTIPSQTEIAEALELIKKNANDINSLSVEAEQKKAALLEKLGITEEEAKLLLS